MLCKAGSVKCKTRISLENPEFFFEKAEFNICKAGNFNFNLKVCFVKLKLCFLKPEAFNVKPEFIEKNGRMV